MFGIGWTEFIFIAIIALLFVGPKQLPAMMQKLGRIVAELKSASRELREQLEAETQDITSPRDMVKDLGRELKKDLPSPYAEAERADRRLRNALDSAAREVNADIAQTSTKDPAGASSRDTVDPSEKLQGADTSAKAQEAAPPAPREGEEADGQEADTKERDS